MDREKEHSIVRCSLRKDLQWDIKILGDFVPVSAFNRLKRALDIAYRVHVRKAQKNQGPKDLLAEIRKAKSVKSGKSVKNLEEKKKNDSE